jgi:hypothetical protein
MRDSGRTHIEADVLGFVEVRSSSFASYTTKTELFLLDTLDRI